MQKLMRKSMKQWVELVKIDEKINEAMGGVSGEIQQLKDEIQALNEKISELLITVKDMNTYEEVLFRLIDLTKDIMNLKTTCSNLDARIVALEGSKGDVDAVSTTDQTLTSLDARVTALEGA